MATRMVKGVDGTWVEVDDAVLADACRTLSPWYKDPALWTQVLTFAGMLFAGWQATSARNKAAANTALVTDVKKEVQTQLPPLTGRPPVTGAVPE